MGGDEAVLCIGICSTLLCNGEHDHHRRIANPWTSQEAEAQQANSEDKTFSGLVLWVPLTFPRYDDTNTPGETNTTGSSGSIL
jgi:hypothetical protein